MKSNIVLSENGNLVATKKFLNNAKYFGTPEYYELRKAMADNPNCKVVARTIRRNPEKKTYKGLTYENMLTFISAVEPTAALEFEFAKKRSVVQRNSYRWMVKWFEARFPYYENPEFTEYFNASIMTADNDAEASRLAA